MILCYCCERRIPESDEEFFREGGCSCAADYCVKCICCERHCRCQDRESDPCVVVSGAKQAASGPPE